MAVDPIIARGAELPDLMRPLILAEEIKNRRETNRLYALNQQFQQQQYAQEQQAAQQQAQQAAAEKAELEDIGRTYELMKSGDPLAVEYAYTNAPPQFKELRKRNPVEADKALMRVMERALGIEAEKVPGAIESQNIPGYGVVVTQGGEFKASRANPAPQQGPTGAWSAPFDAIGADGKPGKFTQHSLTGEVRPVNVAGGQIAPLPKEGNQPGAGLNDRQMAGMNMQQANAIMYAANLTGLPREEVERILATEGPEGVERIMLEKGERWVQGGMARAVQGIPFIGKGIVEATNADLIAPAKGGGAGIALVQNPTGPVATADFQAGEAQFPNAMYPLKTQAAMVRQMLSDGQQMTGGKQSNERIKASDLPPPEALKQLQEGKVTTFANGERWTVQNGQALRVQ